MVLLGLDGDVRRSALLDCDGGACFGGRLHCLIKASCECFSKILNARCSANLGIPTFQSGFFFVWFVLEVLLHKIPPKHPRISYIYPKKCSENAKIATVSHPLFFKLQCTLSAVVVMINCTSSTEIISHNIRPCNVLLAPLTVLLFPCHMIRWTWMCCTSSLAHDKSKHALLVIFVTDTYHWDTRQ